jgi:hypothetical protein
MLFGKFQSRWSAGDRRVGVACSIGGISCGCVFVCVCVVDRRNVLCTSAIVNTSFCNFPPPFTARAFKITSAHGSWFLLGSVKLRRYQEDQLQQTLRLDPVGDLV